LDAPVPIAAWSGSVVEDRESERDGLLAHDMVRAGSGIEAVDT